MNYYLGIDNGGTVTKACIYDSNGIELSRASAQTQTLTPAPGFAERNMEEMWHTNCAVIRRAVTRSGIPAEKIAGIACCGHGKGLYLWGKDGRPAGPGILSADTRALSYVERWRSNGTERAAFAHSMQHVMACQPVALLAWLRDNRPEQLNNAQWVFPCKDYIRFRLTGQARGELSDMSGTGLLNLSTRDYDDTLLRLFGIDFIRDALPPLCTAMESCGTVTESAARESGLTPGTPVFGGMFDIDACALAVGAADSSYICMIAGTWSINEYVRSAPVVDGTVAMNSLFCLPDRYLIEESSATSAGNSEWFLNNILALKSGAGDSVYEKANALAANLPDAEMGPIFLPFIMAGNENPDALGAFIGLQRHHDQRHLVRSVYEGVVFSHRWHLERLLKSRGRPRAIRLAGGAANSPVWVQMFSDILNLPVETADISETGAMGCAIAVCAAVGDAPSAEAAARRMCRFSPAVHPRKALKDFYDKRYALYLDTMRALDTVWSGYHEPHLQ